MKALVADPVPDAQRGTADGLLDTAIGLAALPASLLLWRTLVPRYDRSSRGSRPRGRSRPRQLATGPP